MEGLLLSKDIFSLIDRYLSLEETRRLICISKRVYVKYKTNHHRVGCFSYFNNSNIEYFVFNLCSQKNKEEVFRWLFNWMKMNNTHKSNHIMKLLFYLFKEMEYTDLILMFDIFYPFINVECKMLEIYFVESSAVAIVFNIISKFGGRFNSYMSDVMAYCGLLYSEINKDKIQYIVNVLRDKSSKEFTKTTRAITSLFLLTLCAIIVGNPDYMAIIGLYNNTEGMENEEALLDVLCVELCKGQGRKQKNYNDINSFPENERFWIRQFIQSNDIERYLEKAVKYGNYKMVKEISELMYRIPTDEELLSYPLSDLSAKFVYNLIKNRSEKDTIKLLKFALKSKKRSRDY
jgi:hypothetical protein